MRDAIESMGERIRGRMLELGKTETQLGKETGIDRSQICGYVNGRFTTGMRADRVARIAQALGCSADYLLGLSNDPKAMTEGIEDMLMVMAYQGYVESNVQTLQKLCRDWRRMATQEIGGQPKYAKSGGIDIEVNLERIKMCLLGVAVALARDDEFQTECTKDSDGEILR